MHFDCRFGRAKIGPWKQRKAQIDRCAIERVHSVSKAEPDIVLQRVKFARPPDQNRGEVSP